MTSNKFGIRIALAVVGLWALTACAQDVVQSKDTPNAPTADAAVEYLEGKDYSVLPSRTKDDKVPESDGSGDSVEVLAVFSYTCPHCFRYEPTVNTWLEDQDDSVDFKREHMASSRALENLARAYYVAEDLKILSKTHDALFKAIHEFKLKPFGEADLQRMFKQLAEVDSDTFEEKFWSVEIHERVKECKKKLRDWRITGVPCVVVGGKYLIDAEMSDGEPSKMFAIVDFLVTKLQGEKDPPA